MTKNEISYVHTFLFAATIEVVAAGPPQNMLLGCDDYLHNGYPKFKTITVTVYFLMY